MKFLTLRKPSKINPKTKKIFTTVMMTIRKSLNKTSLTNRNLKLPSPKRKPNKKYQDYQTTKRPTKRIRFKPKTLKSSSVFLSTAMKPFNQLLNITIKKPQTWDLVSSKWKIVYILSSIWQVSKSSKLTKRMKVFLTRATESEGTSHPNSHKDKIS